MQTSIGPYYPNICNVRDIVAESSPSAEKLPSKGLPTTGPQMTDIHRTLQTEVVKLTSGISGQRSFLSAAIVNSTFGLYILEVALLTNDQERRGLNRGLL